MFFVIFGKNENHVAVTIDLSVRGIKKVNVIWKREGEKLKEHMKQILEQSKLKEDDYAKDLDEKGNCHTINGYERYFEEK